MVSRVRPKRTHTEAAPVAQPTSHDDPLPEIYRDITHLPNSNSTQQTNENIHDGQERKRSDRGCVRGRERGHDAREDQCGKGEVHRDQRSTLGRLLRKHALPSEGIPEEDRQVPVNLNGECLEENDEGTRRSQY